MVKKVRTTSDYFNTLAKNEQEPKLIKAIIDENVKATDGSRVRLRLLDDVEIIGFEDGYKGLMYADYQIMKPADFSGILTQGGTILGTSRQPFKQMRFQMKMV